MIYEWDPATKGARYSLNSATWCRAPSLIGWEADESGTANPHGARCANLREHRGSTPRNQTTLRIVEVSSYLSDGKSRSREVRLQAREAGASTVVLQSGGLDRKGAERDADRKKAEAFSERVDSAARSLLVRNHRSGDSRHLGPHNLELCRKWSLRVASGTTGREDGVGRAGLENESGNAVQMDEGVLPDSLRRDLRSTRIPQRERPLLAREQKWTS